MFNKIKPLVGKIAWAVFNIFSPRSICYNTRKYIDIPPSSVLVIVIDYDRFSSRTTKTVGKTTYQCGREGLNYVVDYCRSENIDYIDIVTTDREDAASVYNGPVNKTVYIRNGGSDIAALQALSSLIGQYSFVLVVNSSANVNDAKKISLVHRQISLRSVQHFVIGCNGNSRISPRLPLAPIRTPHVITNLFACPALDLLETLNHASELALYPFVRGFASKYFAIRYFEIMLSRNATYNGGELVLLKGECEKIIYRGPTDEWPRKDSRL